MRLFTLLGRLKCSNVKNPGFIHIGPGRNHNTLYFSRRLASSLTSQKLPTSIRYEKDLIQVTQEQGNLKLVDLIEDAQYGEAYRLKLRLLDSQIQIQRHHAFEKAALSALQWPDQERCLEEFSTWFSLVPNADEAFPLSLLNPFPTIRHALLQSGMPSERLPVIYQFGTICASKGYTEPMFREIFQCVTRYEMPARCCSEMLKFEEAATQYQLDRDPTKAPTVARKYRALTIEICTQLDWLSLACRVAALERKFQLPENTIQYLLEAIKSSKNPFFGRVAQKLRQELILSKKRPNLLHPFADPAESRPVPQGNSAPSNRQHATRAPPPKKTSGINSPVQLLINFNTRRDYHQVVSIYSKYFKKFGVGVFDRTLSQILASTGNSDPEPKATAPLELPNSLQWIVYKCIVQLSSSLPQPLATLESLYKSFLRKSSITRAGRVFGAFISEFGHYDDLSRAQMVVDDLRRLKILEGDYHLSRLAGVYARAGKVDLAMDILDELERPCVVDGQTKTHFPLRYTTYGRIIEGFVGAGMLEPALAVETRLKEVLPYRRRRSPELDRVLDAMRSFQANKKVQHPKERK